jgi:glycosyltransferase involved in cell wall biosynthesis
MSEAVENGVSGFVVPTRDVDGLVGALHRLATDEPLREKMGRAARARAVRDFDLAQQAQAFLRLYTEVLERR